MLSVLFLVELNLYDGTVFGLYLLQLSRVEIYALRFMERTIDDWSRETVAQAQKELEQQKREWELEQIRQLEARNKLGPEFSDEEEMITYSAADAQNQVNKNGTLKPKRGVGRPRKNFRNQTRKSPFDNESSVETPSSSTARNNDLDSSVPESVVGRRESKYRLRNSSVDDGVGDLGTENSRLSGRGRAGHIGRTRQSSVMEETSPRAPASFGKAPAEQSPQLRSLRNSCSSPPRPSVSTRLSSRQAVSSPGKVAASYTPSSPGTKLSRRRMSREHNSSTPSDNQEVSTPESGRTLRGGKYSLRRVVPVKEKFSPALRYDRGRSDSMNSYEDSIEEIEVPSTPTSSQLSEVVQLQESPATSVLTTPTKRRVGRPRKNPVVITDTNNSSIETLTMEEMKKAVTMKDESGGVKSVLSVHEGEDGGELMTKEESNCVESRKANGNAESMESNIVIGKRGRRAGRPSRRAPSPPPSPDVHPLPSSSYANVPSNGLVKSLRSQQKHNSMINNNSSIGLNSSGDLKR